MTDEAAAALCRSIEEITHELRVSNKRATEKKMNNSSPIPSVIEIHDLDGKWLGRVPVSSGEWSVDAAGVLRMIVKRA